MRQNSATNNQQESNYLKTNDNKTMNIKIATKTIQKI